MNPTIGSVVAIALLFVAAAFFIRGLISSLRRDARGIKFTAFALITLSILSVFLLNVAESHLEPSAINNLRLASVGFFVFGATSLFLSIKR